MLKTTKGGLLTDIRINISSHPKPSSQNAISSLHLHARRRAPKSGLVEQRNDVRYPEKFGVWFSGVAEFDNGKTVAVYRQSVGLGLISSTEQARKCKSQEVVKVDLTCSTDRSFTCMLCAG